MRLCQLKEVKMIIKESKFKVCKECGNRELISDEEYGCDGEEFG